MVTSLTLADILQVLSEAISEDQAWALLYSVSQVKPAAWRLHGHMILDHSTSTSTYLSLLCLELDGTLTLSGHGDTQESVAEKLAESDYVSAAGRIVYSALDYGIPEDKSRVLGSKLESLLNLIIKDDISLSEPSDCCGPEVTFNTVIQACEDRLSSDIAAGSYYKNICREMVDDVVRLMYLLKLLRHDADNDDPNTSRMCGDAADTTTSSLETWGRNWVAVMSELRTGITLNPVVPPGVPRREIELTPFERLLKEIREQKYSLSHINITSDRGEVAAVLDVHDQLMALIRSRPELRPAGERLLKPLNLSKSPREQLLESIREQQFALRKSPVSCETSLRVYSRAPCQTRRRLIKPDPGFYRDLLKQDSVDDDESFLVGSHSSESVKLDGNCLCQSSIEVSHHGISPEHLVKIVEDCKYIREVNILNKGTSEPSSNSCQICEKTGEILVTECVMCGQRMCMPCISQVTISRDIITRASSSRSEYRPGNMKQISTPQVCVKCMSLYLYFTDIEQPTIG